MSFTGLTNPTGWSPNSADPSQQVQTWNTPSGTQLQQFQSGNNYYWSDPSANFATGMNSDPNSGLAQIESMYPVLSSQNRQLQSAQSSPLMQAMQQGYNPLQPQYLPTPPQINPTLFSGVNVPGAQTGQAAQTNVALNPQQSLDQLNLAFDTQRGGAVDNLQNQLAQFGISGGQAVGAQNDLQGQLAANYAPTFANVLQTAQGNQLQQALQNMTQQNQFSQFNLGQTNSANQLQAQLAQQAGLANTGYANQAAGTNLENLLATQFANTGYGNQAGQNVLAALLGAYGGDTGAFNQLNLAGLGGQQGIASQGLGISGQLANQQASTFPIQGGSLGSLGGALGSFYGTQPGAQQQQQAPNNQLAFWQGGQGTDNPSAGNG